MVDIDVDQKLAHDTACFDLTLLVPYFKSKAIFFNLNIVNFVLSELLEQHSH